MGCEADCAASWAAAITVKDYVAAGGVKPFKSPERKRQLDGLEAGLRERLIRHRGNADVVRQDLLAVKGVAVRRRTLQRAVQPYRQALKAEALATTRFETPPGRQLQMDFGERLVKIEGAKVKAFVFVDRATCEWCFLHNQGPRLKSAPRH
ncbi:transposase [Bradyrhizobium sp. LB9.1b]